MTQYLESTNMIAFSSEEAGMMAVPAEPLKLDIHSRRFSVSPVYSDWHGVSGPLL